MPKGKKTCPKCGLETGARASTCECGHQFSSLLKTNKESESRTIASRPEPLSADTTTNAVVKHSNNVKANFRSPTIYGPAGQCPCKPEGYKKGWPEGQPSKETIVSWIYEVLNYDSSKNYSPHAIIYWAGQFWDVNGPNCGEDYKKVRSIILETLSPDQDLEI